MDIAKRLEVARQALKDVMPLTLSYFRQPINEETKADMSPVTQADRDTEGFLRKRLLEAFPEDGFFGEETGLKTGNDYQWIIDPIDGTKAFLHGNPLFGTLIGLLYEGVPVLSACSMPAMNDVWLARRGEQALFNGQKISAASTKKLAEAALGCTSPYLFHGEMKERFEALTKNVKRVQFGGDCFVYFSLASGWLDLAIDDNFQPYDILPIVSLIEAAGGKVTDIKGQPLTLATASSALAASTPELHAEALVVLNHQTN